MRVEEYVGARVREYRERHGMSQAELGQRLAGLLGNPWPRQTVSSAERGGRSFPVAELVALAIVLGVAPGELLAPPPTETIVLDLPSGQRVSTARENLEVGPAKVAELLMTLESLARTARDATTQVENRIHDLGAVFAVFAAITPTSPVKPKTRKTSTKQRKG